MMKTFGLFIGLFIFAVALGNTFSQDAPPSVGPAPYVYNKAPESPLFTDAIGTRSFTQISSNPTFQFGKVFLEGCAPTNIGAPFTITFPGGLVTMNGVVYTYNQSSPFQLWSIDTVTGTHTLVFNLTGVPQGNFTGMVWDGTTMYGVSTSVTQSQIFTVNMTTGACTPVGVASSVCAGAIELFGRPGAQYSLFATDIVADNLYKINKATGVFTLVGPLGQNINFGQGGTVDPNDNTFYTSCYTTAAELRKIDTTTGALGPVLCTYTAQATGLAAMGSAPPPPVNCSYSWSIQTSGTTALIYSVKAVSNLIGWAAGAGGVVRKTVDGVTWTNGNPNPGVIGVNDIYNIEAIDANTAWVTTTPGATFIYKTINGGTTWVQVFTLAGGFINTIKMVSATNGYAFGDVLSGVWVIRTTVDGGTTWIALPTAPAGTGDGRNNCLHLSLPNIWFGTGQATVVRSVNAGVTWTVTPATGITGQVTGIQFNTATIGLIGGATMAKTIDGGGTYALLPALGAGTITGIEGSGSNYWYTRGTGIFYSTNDGVSWAQVHTQTAAQNDISLVPDANGCMVGWSAGTGGTISKLTGVPVGINDPTSQIPSTFKLEQNYPNPFNPTTNITFALPIAGNVELKIYDVLGREVANVLTAFVNAGIHTLPFDASSLASGVYIYKITSGSFTDSKKMVLIK